MCTTIRTSVYSGETFTIPAVVVGQRNGVVPGDVNATLTDKRHGSSYLGPLQDSHAENKRNSV